MLPFFKQNVNGTKYVRVRFFLQEKMATQMSSAPAFDALVLKWLHRISRKRNDGNAERKESKHSQTGERKRFFLLFFALLELPKILARQSSPHEVPNTGVFG
jgi:hypothetical protein